MVPCFQVCDSLIDDKLVFAAEALSKAEVAKAELELELNKAKTEETSLRDALLKMQALNEGLGQDKIELNRIIIQVSIQFIFLMLGRNLVEIELNCGTSRRLC